MIGVAPARWSESGRKILAIAALEAGLSGTTYVGMEHLLLALCKAPDAPSETVLAALRIDIDTSRRRLRREVSDLFGSKGDKNPTPTPRMLRALEAAENVRRRRAGDIMVEPIDLLGALLEDGRGPALDFLRTIGADVAAARAAFRRLLPEQPVPDRSAAAEDSGPPTKIPQPSSPSGRSSSTSTRTLDEFGRDLTSMAHAGQLSAPIGRDEEIRLLAQVLMHKLKANPLLIGHPGVGKTCIVEGLARRAAQEGAPPSLRRLRFIELQPAALVAGASHQGDLEERVRTVIQEVRANPEIVLFFDEVHTLLYAGHSSGGAANILKPALARSDFRCIGATTIAEYQRHFEKDAALARRFHVLRVEEPTRDQAVKILDGVRPSLEDHHGVTISEDAVTTAVDLSIRFMTDRYLPDKALDLVDHACSMQTFKTLAIDPSGKMTIDRRAVEDALRALRGIEAGELEEGSRGRLLAMEESLREHVVGQTEAISAVAGTVQARMAGLASPDRPMGVMLFIGPSGVGKTELAKALAGFLFRDPGRMVRIDMSEYSEPHSVSRLFGSPPGYIGHDQEGQLTGPIRAQPSTVVLFDELEKAHPKVYDVFLQIFDEGQLTDSHGHKVDFRNTVIIMTSNLGDWGPLKAVREVKFRMPGDDDSPKALAELAKQRKEQTIKLLEKTLRPELIGRIDKVVFFSPLGQDEVRAVGRKLLRGLTGRVEAQGVKLTIEESVIDLLVGDGYSEAYGARKMRHIIDTRIREPLAKALLSGDVERGGSLTLLAEGGEVKVVVGKA